MSNEYELADDTRAELIFEKQDLLAPLLPGMEPAPHPMVEGIDDKDYYLGEVTRATAGAGALRRRRVPQRGRRPREHLRAAARRGDRHRRPARPSPSGSSAPLAVLAALGMVVRAQGRALGACCSPRRCSRWRVLYIAQDAPFLGVVQVVVYTGAVMMLFLFVLMLVGVDSSDSLVETLRGPAGRRRRWSALGFGVLLIVGLRRRGRRTNAGPRREANAGRQRRRASPS